MDSETPMLFCQQELPLIAAETIQKVTGNPDATPKGLQEACRHFRQRLNQGAQLMKQPSSLPLPNTHCTVCWRCLDSRDFTRASLCYRQRHAPGDVAYVGLRRLSGAVLSRLFGSRPPYCCDAAWNCLDRQEAYVRFEHFAEEAPLNPGCDPRYSYVGQSIRLLPTAPLNYAVQRWQVRHGYDDKPFQEMQTAMRALLGKEVKTRDVRGVVGVPCKVSVAALICDYSRCFRSPEGTDVACLFGQLAFTFDTDDDKFVVRLPSKHSLLAVVPFCRKGGYPCVQNSFCYLKRRFERRPHEVHVFLTKKAALETSLICEDFCGLKRLFLMEAKAPSDEDSEGRWRIYVQVPKPPKKSGRVTGTSKKKAFVPLLQWLSWLARAFDVELDDEELGRVSRKTFEKAFKEETGQSPPWTYIEFWNQEVISLEKDRKKVVFDAAGSIKTTYFLPHLDDNWETKLRTVFVMVAKTFAVLSNLATTDNPPSTKSLSSAADAWAGVLRNAMERGLANALKKSVGVFKAVTKDVSVHDALRSKRGETQQRISQVSLEEASQGKEAAQGGHTDVDEGDGNFEKARVREDAEERSREEERSGEVPTACGCAGGEDVFPAVVKQTVCKSFYEYSCQFLKVRRQDLTQGSDEGRSPAEIFEPKCFWKDARGTFLGEKPLTVIVDAFAEHHCTKLARSGSLQEKGFYFLHDRSNAYDECCTMCGSGHDPFSKDWSAVPSEELAREDFLQFWSCPVCGFQTFASHQPLELCRIAPHKRRVKVLQEAPRSSGRVESQRLQRTFMALEFARFLAEDTTVFSHLCKVLKGQPTETQTHRKNAPHSGGGPRLGSLVAPGTENSARGTNHKRGENIPPSLADDLVDCRASKDNNPDIRVYLTTGSVIQDRPTSEEFRSLEEELHRRLCPLKEASIPSEFSPSALLKLEVRGNVMYTFPMCHGNDVLLSVRFAVHEVAMKFRKPELCRWCPVLKHTRTGAVVRLLCSGHELVRPVGWRALCPQEQDILSRLTAGLEVSVLDVTGLHESWQTIPEEGLTWEMLLYAKIVTYAALDDHLLLKESVEDLPKMKSTGDYGDGLTFYKLGPELESAIRMLQIEDSVVWAAGHPIRQGYGATAADSAHKTEPLQHGKRCTSSIRSIGHDPYKVNMRNFIGSAPDNHYGTTLKLVAVLHDLHTCMQEDSFPESLDAYRHSVLRSHSITFESEHHWKKSPPALGYHQALKLHAVAGSGQSKMTPQDLEAFVACISDETGLVSGPYTFVRAGQAVCFVAPPPPGKKVLKTAPCDLWVKRTFVHEQKGMDGSTFYRYEIQCMSVELMRGGQKLGKLYQKFVSTLLEDWVSGGLGRVTGLLSSSSIASRTAVQNIVRSWMTSLALATGVGTLRLQESLSEDASYILEAMHSSRPLSASALTALRRRTPGASVSNRVPLVSGRQGRFLGNCLQYMMSVFVAVQDGSKPNGSVNGVNERGRATPGQIRLDPIMTAVYRFLGLEQHEEKVDDVDLSVCGTCGSLRCSGCRLGENKRRRVALNPSFARAINSLANLNLDVKFGLETDDAAGEEEPMPEPEDMCWAAVPRNRGCISMADALRGEEATVHPEKPIVKSVIPPDGKRRLGLSFGGAPAGRVLADQLIFGLRSTGGAVAWDSGDKTRGYTVVSSASKQAYQEALVLASGNVGVIRRALKASLSNPEFLALNRMTDIAEASLDFVERQMLYLGVEPGGTLQLHTRGLVS